MVLFILCKILWGFCVKFNLLVRRNLFMLFLVNGNMCDCLIMYDEEKGDCLFL